MSSNFVPFRTITGYVLHTANNIIAISNVIGNIVLFVPFGLLFPGVAGRRLTFVSLIAYAFLLSLAFELIQLISRIGSFDVDDLILNTFGAALGFIVVKGMAKLLGLKGRMPTSSNQIVSGKRK